MPAAAAGQDGAAGSEPVTVHGWELHVTGRGRDAYYAVLVTGTNVITAWGRRGADCQAAVHRHGSVPGALRQAQQVTDEKAGKGYVVTRDYTALKVPGRTVSRALGDSKTQATGAARELLKAFRAASAAQGHDLEGASR